MTAHSQIDALIVGAGPAGLMAAEVISAAGFSVIVAEAKPSPARKFLMAGKSGLNLTKNEPPAPFLAAYDPIPDTLREALMEFGPKQVITWAEGLGQEMFTGSSGRVFPKVMKASPLLRAWLSRLDAQGVDLRRNWRMTALGDEVRFDTPEGPVQVSAKTVVLALGGASWARLGSNGAWLDLVSPYVALAPFMASNVGILRDWSPHMTRHFGAPLKGVCLTSGGYSTRGECVISARGIEGGGVYAVTRGLRTGAPLRIDLLPDWSEERVKQTLIQRKSKETLTTFLKRAFRLPPEKIALMLECAGPKPTDLYAALKHLEITDIHLRPMDEAISTAGGVCFDSLSDDLAAKPRPDLFFAGEMLDWDAPTGGYLLTACLATGRLAGQGAIKALS
ncbi:MAG: TIGR03862 family flavoprotein [Alphaproteobacteria bacterium]|nr:TIGR03862 family flavoprotein [Alphaproteobacteria bacterium]MBU1574270.1 TIGR03862 family flavoprotein [Alphaproteobacteria bacterium]MBU2077117.1 TIGR03862 family flavoprotein [Alphaproteobacteria bacterium]MBU2161369.1 TIGR03862 family flavoprotein [Alphaproteobacteria bacterium]MBU2242248.1 TIGR03862 family flavoprotein [Alphaproteobacteria bacterium]